MGGKSQPAPDYGPMQQLGREQLEFAKQQYAEMKPLAQQVYGQQMAAQQQQMAQAKDYYDYQQRTFRPLEQGLVRDAERFSTEGYREQQARDAAAAVGRAFDTTQAMSSRAMASRGINPNSGAGMALATQGNLGLAAGRANAMTSARNQAEQMGYARRLEVTGLGRNLAGAANAAYGGATAAGSAGINTAMAPGSQQMQGFAQAGQTYGGVLNNQTSQFNAGLNAEGQVIGGLVGAGATLGAAAIGSDLRLKENIERVGTLSNGIGVYEFEYKPTFKDHPQCGHGRFRGVMAQEVELITPEAVVIMANGYKAVKYAELGIEMVEV